MEWLTGIYLLYIFVALYFLVLFTMTFLQNKKDMFNFPKTDKHYSISVLIPAFNEQDSLKGTVESVLKSEYNIKEIIIINDGSSDNTQKIAKELEKKHSKVKLFDKPNSGKGDSLNQAIKIAKGELVAVVDADSYPSEDAILKMVGYFDDEEVGAVTTRILVRNPDNFIQKLQMIEYKVVSFSRRLLGFLDAIYVTPGPLALYRKSALVKVGGFDTKNITEDIEMTWHLVFEGYKIKMSFMPYVTTVAPNGFKKWFKQRVRWNIGGFQTIIKYRRFFMRKGMLGWFILPFFTISLFLGVLGLTILLYRFSKRFLIAYLSTKYSIQTQTSVLMMQDLNLHPSILVFFGLVLLIFGILFTLFALYVANLRLNEKTTLFSIAFYSLIYITLYPVILIISLYKFATKKYSWR